MTNQQYIIIFQFSDSTNIRNHPLTGLSLSTIAKNVDNNQKHFSIDIFDFNNSCKGLLQKDSVALSAYYYSNCHEVRTKLRYTEPVIKSTLKPSIDMNIELPKEHKDYSRIDVPMHHSHRKEIFNIIPVTSVKIIEDPLLHRITPIEEAPSRKYHSTILLQHVNKTILVNATLHPPTTMYHFIFILKK